MLSINTTNAILRVIRETYCSQVAVRQSLPRWSLPRRWWGQIVRIASACEVRGITDVSDVRNYVIAQFEHFDMYLCLRLFRMKYPPINVLLNSRSFERYHEKLNRTPVNSREVTFNDALETARTEVKRFGKVVTKDLLEFNIANGTLSVYAVTYMRYRGIVTHPVADELIEFFNNFDKIDVNKIYDKFYSSLLEEDPDGIKA